MYAARTNVFSLRRLCAIISTVTLLVGGTLVSSGTLNAATHSGTVEVLSAGSLSNIMLLVESAFKKDTGYSVQDVSEGSSAIASGVAAKTLQGDVFISASVRSNLALEGAQHGNWINGYTRFGQSPTVLAYYPKSRFATALKTRPWYDVIRSSGFQLGRTNPAVDPGGVLDIDALKGIGYGYNIPSLLTLASDNHNVYTEEALPGLLQAGQLDAAFMYAVSAHAARLPFITLTGTKNLDAHYTIALLNRAPDRSAGAAFVQWLLSRAGRSLMQKQGLVAVTPAHYFAAAR